VSSKPTKAPSSWRDVLPIHPAAELFPRMSEDELLTLGEDIKKRGLASAVILWSPGYLGDGMEARPLFVLDGCNRLDAMERAGLPVVNAKGKLNEFHGACFVTRYEKRKVYSMEIGGRGGASDHVEPWTDPYQFVISANINRRHLTAEQKRELIAKLLKADPNKSDRQIGAMTKADNKTVAKVRREQERREEIPHVEARTDTKGREQPAKKPARKPAPVERGDVGPASNGEVERLRARVGELENEKRRLETRIIGLESENAELRARLPLDDDLDIPTWLRRH
jgi:hypothetical protein